MLSLAQMLAASAVILAIFAAARALSGRLGHPPWASPVLVGAGVVAVLLHLVGVALPVFNQAAMPLRWLLGPALVALALVVEANKALLRRSARPLLIAVPGGAVFGLAAAVITARALGLDGELARAVTTKTATTPFSVAIMMRVGGPVELAAAISVATGVIGALTIMPLFKALGWRGRAGPALGLGVAAHIVGTDWLSRRDAIAAGLSALAFVLAGLTLALVVPPLWPWLWS